MNIGMPSGKPSASAPKPAGAPMTPKQMIGLGLVLVGLVLIGIAALFW